MQADQGPVILGSLQVETTDPPGAGVGHEQADFQVFHRFGQRRTCAGLRQVHRKHAGRHAVALLQLRGQDILRSKGILAIDGAPRRYVYQGVHMMMDADWGTPWKDGEKRSSKLVFIGRNLDGENLKRGFEECLK